MERDAPDVPLAVPGNDHHYNDPDSDSKEEDTSMADPKQASDGATGGEVKKKYDPKDPFRPRRKKARRACYACQRAHLTCGKIDPVPTVSDPSLVLFCPRIKSTSCTLLPPTGARATLEDQFPASACRTTAPHVCLFEPVASCPTATSVLRLKLWRRVHPACL